MEIRSEGSETERGERDSREHRTRNSWRDAETSRDMSEEGDSESNRYTERALRKRQKEM